MARIAGPRVVFACLAAFVTLLQGVMAETLDSDLIGVVAAGACIGVLLIVVIAFIACCCYRRIESDRKSELVRKDSGSVSTNGMTPRLVPSMVPSGMPMYTVPAEPVLYAVPAPQYYLGHYAPKFIDAEALDVSRHVYMQNQHTSQRGNTEVGEERAEEEVHRESHHVEHVTRDERETQEVAVREETTAQVLHQRQEEETTAQVFYQTQAEETTTQVLHRTQAEEVAVAVAEAEVDTQAEAEVLEPQSNGVVANEFSASSLNYKVIRKQQHKHEKMPEWLRKSYSENEQSMDIGDDTSRSSDELPNLDLIPLSAEEQVHAHVSPHHSFLDSGDVLTVPEGFTIVDYVDPENRPRPSSSFVLSDAGSGGYVNVTTTAARDVTAGYVNVTPAATRDVTADVITSSRGVDSTSRDVSTTRDVAVVSDVTEDGSSKKTTTTTTVVTTTTYYADGSVIEEVGSAGEGGSRVPPASTSTPTPPSPLPPPPPPPPPHKEMWELNMGVGQRGSGDLSHSRMRKRGEGSLSDMPQLEGY